jgi:hypothetical protein
LAYALHGIWQGMALATKKPIRGNKMANLQGQKTGKGNAAVAVVNMYKPGYAGKACLPVPQFARVCTLAQVNPRPMAYRATATYATAIRLPLAVNATAKKGQGQGNGQKSQYMLALLQMAGNKGITWQAMQAALTAKFGNAPKKRRSLYLLLANLTWHKVTGANGVCTYFLGAAPKK